MKLKGQVCLITGGGRGIGKAVAMAYAREGATLALCARSAGELEQSVGEIRALAVECEGWTCDVSLEEPVRDFVTGAHKRFGRIDVLVNNAGVMTRPAPMTELETKKRLHHQCLVDDRSRRLRQLCRLCGVQMGIGRTHRNPSG